MKGYLRRRKGLFALTLMLTVVSDLILVGATVLEQRLIDAVMLLNSAEILRYIPLVILYALFSGAVYVMSSVSQELFSAKVTDDMRCAVFSGILKRNRRDFFEVNHSDYLSALTNDLHLIRRQYLGMLFLVVVFGGSLIFSGGLMFWYQPLVAVTALACAAGMTVIPMVLGKWLGKWEAAHSQKLSALTTCLNELFSGFGVIASFGLRKYATEKFQACSSELKSAEYRADGMSAFSDGLAQLLSVMAQTSILALACYMVFQGKMTMGGLVAVNSLNQTFCGAFTMVLRGIPMLRGVQPVIHRVNRFAESSEERVNKKTPTFAEWLEVQDLSFQYREGEPVLERVSLTVKPGEKCALVGESGSGKTTLIRLLTGELDGYGGRICYDGTELRECEREAVCSIASVIQQEVFLFDDTIRNNICLFDAFSDEEFERAVHLSGVQKFMDNFPEGAEYQVGQRGEFLSGGQRQRIAIARALIRRTPLLILDEGTSALDERTAGEIEAELMAIPELALLTITHHLRDPEQYDQIFALQK